ncbi:hypothetical protein AG0111_0g11501 [Alternaria gaisen]|uniref:Uncharacterized protein n=1 Tax=Alternaria gaisen TaxID=167740 RepID=A0ACB6F7D5_9PLEO|nr:hypothetical protein AG0111_0g11501 [Alternaria gaisen]
MLIWENFVPVYLDLQNSDLESEVFMRLFQVTQQPGSVLVRRIPNVPGGHGKY